MELNRRTALKTLAAAGLTLPWGVQAQSVWTPARPIRIVVPFPAGGTNDLMARPLAEAFRERFGQPAIIENRAGAGGTIGASNVARSAPDGHTLLVTSAIIVTSSIVQPVDWTPSKDFTAIAQIARSPNAVAVNADLPIRNMQELIAYAKAHPDKMNYGSVGNGSLGHFITEAISREAGIKMEHVPYRGGGAAVSDLASGRLQLLVSTPPPIVGLAKEGRVRIIAYTAAGDQPEGLAAPTLREAGINFEGGLWFGMFGPANMPAAVVERLNAEVNRALAAPELDRLLRTEGAIPTPTSPQAFLDLIRSEETRWREVARIADIKA